jgi:hypothetical protein
MPKKFGENTKKAAGNAKVPPLLLSKPHNSNISRKPPQMKPE